MKISLKTHYIRTDGWRGYSEPIYAVAGANDTGEFSDSLCPTHICLGELREVKKLLKEAGIAFKTTACTTSNVFCIHRYVVTSQADADKAREIVRQYIDSNYTRLLYVAGKSTQTREPT